MWRWGGPCASWQTAITCPLRQATTWKGWRPVGGWQTLNHSGGSNQFKVVQDCVVYNVDMISWHKRSISKALWRSLSSEVAVLKMLTQLSVGVTKSREVKLRCAVKFLTNGYYKPACLPACHLSIFWSYFLASEPFLDRRERTVDSVWNRVREGSNTRESGHWPDSNSGHQHEDEPHGAQPQPPGHQRSSQAPYYANYISQCNVQNKQVDEWNLTNYIHFIHLHLNYMMWWETAFCSKL